MVLVLDKGVISYICQLPGEEPGGDLMPRDSDQFILAPFYINLVIRDEGTGLLQRRHVQIDQIKNIGKESNSLEDVESSMIHSAQNVYSEYPDPRRDEWQTKIVPALRNVSLRDLKKESRLSRRMLIKARTGRTRPHPRNQKLLTSLVRKLSAI